ncbi:hypothetical protein GE061_010462 [Apolygus lucorum]|uniref:non-specific serine/threonine protein kinase n=1 Tax=Apolygus lucorum TaxID=248454 RepID=A0A8S9XVY6_APOLU|nr:hypothetical protein GE061_010462 [Apolygus lucorum]
MAPIVRTYQGKKQQSLKLKVAPISTFRKDDSFDRIFGQRRATAHVFSSSSEASASFSRLELISPDTVDCGPTKHRFFSKTCSGEHLPVSDTPKGIKKRKVRRKGSSPFILLDEEIEKLKVIKKLSKKKSELLKPVSESTPVRCSSDTTLGLGDAFAALQLQDSSSKFQTPLTMAGKSSTSVASPENGDEIQKPKPFLETSYDSRKYDLGETFVIAPSPIIDSSVSKDVAEVLSKSLTETSNVETHGLSSDDVHKSASKASTARVPRASGDYQRFAGFSSPETVTPLFLKKRRDWLQQQKTSEMTDVNIWRSVSMHDVILANSRISDKTEMSDSTASTVKQASKKLVIERSFASLPKYEAGGGDAEPSYVFSARPKTSGSLRNSPKQSSKFTTCDDMPQGSLSSGDSPDSCRSSEDLSRESFNEKDEEDEDNFGVNRPIVPSQIPLHNLYEQRTLEPLQENLEELVEEMEEESSSLSSKSSPAETPDSSSNRTPNMRRKSSRYSEERSPTGRSSIGRALVTPDLISVVEESDSDSFSNNQIEELPPLEHFNLPPGKKYRRSLAILRSLEHNLQEETSNLKGRLYKESVEEVLRLQDSTFTGEAPDVSVSLQTLKQRLSVRRTSLMKQMTPPPRRRSTRRPTLYETPCSSFTFVGSNRELLPPQLTRGILDGTLQTPGVLSRGSIRPSFRPDVSILTERDESILTERDVSLDILSPGEPPAEASVKDLILKISDQTDFVQFSDILKPDCYVGAEKLGEGVYGEVFGVTRGEEKTVIKIIPVEGELRVNGAEQKTYNEIVPELLISVELSSLRLADREPPYLMAGGFVPILKVSLVQGKYPKGLMDLWIEFDEAEGSENDSPEVFNEQQLYIVIEQANGGRDLENYSFSTAKQVVSIFKQVVFALAVAECAMEFEHRDLHWANVLVSRTKEMQVSFWLRGVEHKIKTDGVKATIIDYSLSRMKYRDVYPMFLDLSKDPDLFIGTGDFQFDVYRQMKKDVGNDWKKHVPKTNVRWLHYLVDKMQKKVKYQRKTAKVHKDSMMALQEIESWIDSCDSALDVALNLLKKK